MLRAWLSREPRLDDVAETVTEAAYTGNASVLLRYAWPDEVKLNGLTPAKIDALWREAVFPHLKGLHRTKGADKRASDHQGVDWIYLEDNAGHLLVFGATPDLTDDGPRQTIQDFMFQAWLWDYVLSKGIPYENRSIYKAYLRGIAEHQAFFKSIGMNYRVTRVAGGKMIEATWDDEATRIAALLRKMGADTDYRHIP